MKEIFLRRFHLNWAKTFHQKVIYMFLAVDAGNTNITFGFFDTHSMTWKFEYRINTLRDLTALQIEKEMHLFFLENDLKPFQIDQIGISSVVTEINAALQQFCREFFGKPCYLIEGRSYQKLKVSTARPNEIGSDLMCNVTAAFEYFGGACVIVDFGTALTFTVVGEDGRVLGVSIVPGLKTAIKALFSNTSKLPEVELKLPKSVLGKNTTHSIQSGILYGYSGLVTGMLESIFKELGSKCPVVATGGLSSILSNVQHLFDKVDRNLTLEGIRLITMANLG